jgi:hypothetical protein
MIVHATFQRAQIQYHQQLIVLQERLTVLLYDQGKIDLASGLANA